LRGVVSQFDDAAGLGEVTADAGTVYGFHCTQIAARARSPSGRASSSTWRRGTEAATRR
jgi:hypothetical protein